MSDGGIIGRCARCARGLPAGKGRLSRLRLRDGRQNFRFPEQFEPDVFWKQHGKKILAAAARCWIRDYPGKPVAAQPRLRLADPRIPDGADRRGREPRSALLRQHMDHGDRDDVLRPRWAAEPR